MTAFFTLIRREWLESRLPFLWFPLGTLAALILVCLVTLGVSGFAEIHVVVSSDADEHTLFFIDQWSARDWDIRMTAFRNAVTAPFYVIYVIGALFVLLGTLYDERKDRSVLFWKSLPVSDLATVLSKLVVPVWIAPLIMIGCAVAAQIFLLALASIYVASNDLGSAWQLWQHGGLATGALSLVLGFVIQGLWVLPVAAYLLLVSTTAPRLTLLWALALPIVPAILEYVVFRTRILATGFAKHVEPAALPNFTGDDDRIMPVPETLGDQLSLLLNPDLWIGVVVGAALLCAAARIRGVKNEL